MKNEACDCERKNGNVIFACSGSSDVGELTDLVARKLNKEGIGEMHCLAKLNAGYISEIKGLAGAKTLVIDGCDMECGKKLMNNRGLSDFIHLRLSDLGI